MTLTDAPKRSVSVSVGNGYIDDFTDRTTLREDCDGIVPLQHPNSLYLMLANMNTGIIALGSRTMWSRYLAPNHADLRSANLPLSSINKSHLFPQIESMSD